jgi:hypothetical protein
MRLEVFDPSGFSESTEPSLYAPRLPNLNCKTIGEISNGEHGGWEVDRTFPLIRQSLKKRFPDIKLIPYTEFPSGVSGIDVDNIGDIVAAKSCDAVIGGNAA